MRLAIVGAQGFVGTHVAAEAMRRGWMVTSIGRNTPLAQLKDVDAVVHTVGSFMTDQRYKKLISSPVSVKSLAQLAAMKIGLDPPNPLRAQNTFDSINYKPVEQAALALKHSGPRTPFVYISATNWSKANPEYIASKRKAEQLLSTLPYLRPVFLRPGFISPKTAADCSRVTPRHLIDAALRRSGSQLRVSVEAVALAACDAVEDNTVEGVIGCDVLNALQI